MKQVGRHRSQPGSRIFLQDFKPSFGKLGRVKRSKRPFEAMNYRVLSISLLSATSTAYATIFAKIERLFTNRTRQNLVSRSCLDEFLLEQ
jgi:hypothetical protein